jgi:uncharacterized protein (TIGR02599 family)
MPPSSRPCVALPRVRKAGPGSGFTLVELLVSMVVLLILVVMMVSMTNQTSKIWQTSRARIEAFQGARNAYERITGNLSQATLNTYYDYYNAQGQSRTDVLRASPGATFTATTYDRASDLQLVCGQASTLVPPTIANGRPTHAIFFQAPLGHVNNPAASGSQTALQNDFKNLDRVLNAVGYYIDFTDDSTLRPPFITTAVPSWRYRLMELNQPSQNLAIYFLPSASDFSGNTSWFTAAVNPMPTPAPGTANPATLVAADNVVALIVLPKLANQIAGQTAPQVIAPAYAYDTKGYFESSPPSNATAAKNQLPPLIQVTMVALDSNSAARLASLNGTNPPALYTNSPFSDITQYTADMTALQSKLQSLQMNYRVFVSDVSLPGSKWTTSN